MRQTPACSGSMCLPVESKLWEIDRRPTGPVTARAARPPELMSIALLRARDHSSRRLHCAQYMPHIRS